MFKKKKKVTIEGELNCKVCGTAHEIFADHGDTIWYSSNCRVCHQRNEIERARRVVERQHQRIEDRQTILTAAKRLIAWLDKQEGVK